MLIVNKKRGETPLQTLNRLRKEKPELAHEKLSYAGRLDPMAEGLLLVLVGEENKRRNKYLGLDKTYQITIVFGLDSDTHDALGLVNYTWKETQNIEEEIFALSKDIVGDFMQPYPLFSSKPFKGKPLFKWAREDKFDLKNVPSKKVSIYGVRITECIQCSLHEITLEALTAIEKVEGDFRQAEVSNRWKKISLEHGQAILTCLSLEIFCSSGTYMRGIAHDLGKKLGVGGIAIKIRRTAVGNFKL